MEGPNSPQRFAVFQLHKSVGVTILLLTLARIGWRLTHRPPPPAASLHGWERLLARVTHIGFYLLLIALPITGWLTVSTSRRTIPTLLYGAVPWPNLPGTAALDEAARGALHDAAEAGHGLFVYAMLLLLALHVAGALKHHLLDRDTTLARMLPGVGRRADWRLIAALLLLLGIFVAGGRMALAPVPPTPAAASSESVSATAPIAVTPERPAGPRQTAPLPTAAPGAVAADTAEEGKPAATPVEPSRWRVGPGSSVGFTSVWSGGTVKGQFSRFTADIRFDPAALDRSSVDARIDMTSVSTADPDSNSALPGPDFFDTAKYAEARFDAKRFVALGGDRYEARGTLRLRGVARPLSLPFTLRIDGDEATMRGTAKVDRTAQGVGQGQWAATDALPATVAVTIAITAQRTK